MEGEPPGSWGVERETPDVALRLQEVLNAPPTAAEQASADRVAKRLSALSWHRWPVVAGAVACLAVASLAAATVLLRDRRSRR